MDIFLGVPTNGIDPENSMMTTVYGVLQGRLSNEPEIPTALEVSANATNVLFCALLEATVHPLNPLAVLARKMSHMEIDAAHDLAFAYKDRKSCAFEDNDMLNPALNYVLMYGKFCDKPSNSL